jgi:AcrR family transcriptional regulator
MTRAADRSRPAHRPSRREEIIDAAIKVFARTGYAEASVDDIARECGVAATAIYYHFGGKDELFNQALMTSLDRFSNSVNQARATGSGKMDRKVLRHVIAAGQERTLAYPDEALFLLHHTYRPTAEARRLQQAWEELHAQQFFDYLPQPQTVPRSPRKAREQHASRLLASRVVVGTTIISQAARLNEGPLSHVPLPNLMEAVGDICVRIVTGVEKPVTARATAKPTPAEPEPSDNGAPRKRRAPR